MHKWMRLLCGILALMLLPAACAQQNSPFREDVTTILLAGTDRRPDQEIDPLDFRSGGQADFLMLLALDGENNTITPIHIDRDTMTSITTLSVLGREAGSRTAQICLAHSFGDGGERSAGLLCDALSGLLGGVPIDYYFTLSMYALPEINDAIGGVEVTLTENDDFSAYDETMVPGKTLRLMGRQAYYYATRRFYVGDGSNASRQARQRTYIYAAIDQLMERISADGLQVLEEIAVLLDQHAHTNLSPADFGLLAITALNSEILPIRTLEGVHQTGSGGFVEFWPDEEALDQLVQDIFCVPAA